MIRLYLLRGLPGAGKSTVAKAMAEALDFDHYEMDMARHVNGKYIYRPEDTPRCHRWCYNRTKASLRKGRGVIVSNTFVRRYHLNAYTSLALALKVPFAILHVQGQNFGSLHDVPEEQMKRMRNAWSHFV